MVSSEATPYAKTGGLADCVASLARELASTGTDVRLLMPYHGTIPEELRRLFLPLANPLAVHLAWDHWARIHEHVEPSGLRVYLLEHHGFFSRDRLYDDGLQPHGDNPQRFAFLSRAAIDLATHLGWIPDVIHCHDWMTAPVPVFLETVARTGPLTHTGSVLTIHNLAHQGFTSPALLEFAGLPHSLLRPDRMESCGGINFLKGGLYFANKLTTVSPTYAREIRTSRHGCGLDDVLRFRGGDLLGILNGVDATVWDPATDSLIPHPFSLKNPAGKRRCKQHFCADRYADGSLPLVGIIARFCDQKGLDVLAEILPRVLETMAMNFAVLGAGDGALERRYRDLAHRYRSRVFVHIGYDEPLAHRIEAAGDFFLMPSRFEPCGLNQLYSLRYGTLPIARSTGGLRDSIQSYEESTGAGTGFLFQDLSPQSLYNTLGWACSTYYDRRGHMAKMIHRAMEQDFSWKKSAQAYADVYRWARDMKR
jgi:starch synthase